MSIGRRPGLAIPSRSWQGVLPHVELARSFQARHLQVALAQAGSVDTGATVREALTLLDQGNWDHAPATDAGRIVGYVERTRLRGAAPDMLVAKLAAPLGGGTLVSADSSIAELIEWLPGQRILFVIDGREITGFVTVLDLNKQPARAYLYLVIAGLEIALADLLRWRYGADQTAALELLGKRDQDSVRGRLGADREADADSDLVSYLGFKHLLRVIEADRPLRDAMGGYSKTRWRSVTWPLSELRNDVMHPISSFVTHPDHVVTLGQNVRRANVLIGQAVESLRRHYGFVEPQA